MRRFIEELGRDLPGVFSRRPPASPPSGAPSVPIPGLPAPAPSASTVDRERAGILIRARVEQLAAVLGLEYGRVFIKDQRTLWASCSGKKNLNFNWRLAAAPAEILDYVVIHELCHLREMNHSKKFWGLVAGHCPDYKARKKWLRVNAMTLKSGGARVMAAIPV